MKSSIQKFPLLFLVAVLFFISCGGDKGAGETENLPVLVLNMEEIPIDTALNYSSVFDKFQKVELEVTDQSYLMSIRKLCVSEKYVFALDYRQKKIVMFDKSGKFIKEIGRVGKGPGEYVSPYVIRYSNHSDELMILDRGRIFIIYDSEGNYLRQEKHEIFMDDFYPVDSGIYATAKPNRVKEGDHFINFISNDKKIYPLEGIEKDIPWNYNLSQSYFTSYGDQLYYFGPFLNKIYKLTGLKGVPIIEINRNHEITSDELDIMQKGENRPDKMTMHSFDFYTGPFDFIMRDDLCFLLFNGKADGKFAPAEFIFIDMENDKHLKAETRYFNDDLANTRKISPPFRGIAGNSFIKSQREFIMPGDTTKSDGEVKNPLLIFYE